MGGGSVEVLEHLMCPIRRHLLCVRNDSLKPSFRRGRHSVVGTRTEATGGGEGDSATTRETEGVEGEGFHS